MKRNIYIKSAAHISLQMPLSDSWMEEPLPLTGHLQFAQDPDFRSFIKPMEARRMSKMMKRALVTSLECLQAAGVEHPDAIVSGTGLGCIEETEKFLKELCIEGEAYLKPTYFMQSTHNTIGSLIGIKTGSHGYNSTYSQCCSSFECALADAKTQLELGKINNALVGGFDGMTEDFHRIYQSMGLFDGTCPMSEVSASFFLDTDPEGAICKMADVRILYRPDEDILKQEIVNLLSENEVGLSQLSLVLAGYNGNPENDRIYDCLAGTVLKGCPSGGFKHLFGESHSASAIAFYAAVACFRHGIIAGNLALPGADGILDGQPENILVINHFNNKEFTLTLLCGK